MEEEGLPLNGTFLTIVLEISEADVSSFELGKALILSTLFPHETKLSAMHFKIKRTTENKDIIPSKIPMEFHCGFRRFQSQPIFAQETNPGAATEKYKYLRFLRDDDSAAIASVYAPIVYNPCKILCFTEKSLKSEGVDSVVATGVAMTPNPLRVILKRIILTGYPLRVHKKKATVRYMFFNPSDIKYFKPVELYTKEGLKGHIKQSLGTHGLMKCVFNDFIKHSDVVCMPLYRRVFPVWHPRTWDPHAPLVEKKSKTLDFAEEDKTAMSD